VTIRDHRARRDERASAGAVKALWALAFVAFVMGASAFAWPPREAPGNTSRAPATVQQDAPEFADSPIYTWLEENRAAAYWVAPLLMVAVAILPIPAEIPAAMNGMLFGAFLGILMTWGGAMIGAVISYELARCFGMKLARRVVSPEVMSRLDGLKDTEAPVLLMLRLTPMVAFTVVNWSAGLLQVRRPTFIWTTAVGILPGAIAFTASGSAISRLYERNPGAVTAVVLVLCGALLLRVWWKRRAVPTP
jgi:uncharacterized membrane protein YdjX (TVP38/TMEM64 family)